MMKHFTYIALLLTLIFVTSCEEQDPASWSGIDRLNFVRAGSTSSASAADTIVVYTFVFENPEVTQYTLWVNVATMGKVYDHPRPLKIKQVPSFINLEADDIAEDAVAGQHYVPFDDAQVRDQYVIPAGVATAQIPVILKRDRLGSKVFQLRITFEGNDYFQPGYGHLGHKTIVISDKLARPSLWTGTLQSDMLGTYSQEKHQFMFDVTGLSIDNAYLQGILDTNDRDYYRYLRAWFTLKLNEENERRTAAGEPLLTFTF